MSYIVTIAGSASASPESSAVLEAARRILRRHGFHSDAIVLRNLPATDLLWGRPERSPLEAAYCLIERAQAIILATPIQEAISSSLLKVFLETLPPHILVDKTILSVTTGASNTPVPPDDRWKVLTARKVGCVLPALSISDAQIQFEHGGLVRLEESAETQLRNSLDELICAVRPASSSLIDRFRTGTVSGSAHTVR